MHLIINRTRFVKMLKLTNDRKNKRRWLYDTTFVRLEAQKDRLLISGKAAEAEFPAAVFIPGVLFVRARKFYEMTRFAPEGEELELKMLPDGVHVGDVTFPWDAGDALLYLDPTKAPQHHPEEGSSAKQGIPGSLLNPPEEET
jgi:hypothetical protein